MRTFAGYAFAFALTAMPASAPTADLVVHNARVYTLDAARPLAEAFAVAGGRFVRVGAEAEAQAAFPEAPRLDAGGGAVFPGFIDAHVHLMDLGISLLEADLTGAASLAEALDRLEAYARRLPPGAWLLGRGWDQNDWPGAAFPTRADLDARLPGRRVWLRRTDSHAGWAGTAALRAAGIDPDEPPPDPPGGRLLRDAAGRASGVLIDAALPLVDAALPPRADAQLDEALALALAEARRYGLTGVHEAGADLGAIRRFRRAADEGRLTTRIYAMIDGLGPTLDAFCADGPLLDPEHRVVVRAVKFFIDGALGSRGAALLEPYADEPGCCGLTLMPPAAFGAAVRRAVDCGFQVNTHAIGDRGVRLVLDAYAAAPGERCRIEHAQVVHPADLPRFRALGVVASVQPTHATSDMGWAEQRLGPERIGRAYAWRSLAETGVPLALGSDFPIEAVNPLLGFYAAVTRQDAGGAPPGGWRPQERLTRAQALHGFTLGAAYAAFAERDLGSIEPGKLADFVLLSADIMTIPAPEILGAHVLATYLSGKPVYEKRPE